MHDRLKSSIFLLLFFWYSKSCAICAAFILSQVFIWFFFDTAIYLTSRSMYHLLTTQIFIHSLDYVTRNAAVSSSSITKSYLVISWPARKSIPSLSFLRCISLGWVASCSLLKLNKSSYKSIRTFIKSRDKWTL